MTMANKLIVCKKCGGSIESRDEAHRTDSLDYLCSDCHIDATLEQFCAMTSEMVANDSKKKERV